MTETHKMQQPSLSSWWQPADKLRDTHDVVAALQYIFDRFHDGPPELTVAASRGVVTLLEAVRCTIANAAGIVEDRIDEPFDRELAAFQRGVKEGLRRAASKATPRRAPAAATAPARGGDEDRS